MGVGSPSMRGKSLWGFCARLAGTLGRRKSDHPVTCSCGAPFACRAARMGRGRVWKICLEGAELTYLWSLTYEGSLGST